MELSAEQKNQVREWIAANESLSGVQERLKQEFGISLTYMEARLLMSELEVVPAEKVVEEPVEDVVDEAGEDSEAEAETEEAGNGQVQVTMDQITKPNFLVSGRVSFSDGKGAAWYLDHSGRLGLDVDEEGYRPSEEDVMAFQQELRKLIGA